MQSAGLGAMLQARGSAGAGATKDSMNELMAMARGLPDSELADVLAGKSVRVPQFAAMLEAMGRKSLHNAVQGAQAGAMKQPNKKEQMLAELQGGQAAGLAAVPAPNMEQMGEGMADGGIVAFSGKDGSSVEDPLAQFSGITPEALAADAARIDRLNAERILAEEIQRRAFLRQAAPHMLPPVVVTAEPEGSLTEGITPSSVAASEAQLPKTIASTAPAGPGPARTNAVAPKAGLDALTAARAEAPAGRKSPIDELTAPLEEIRKQIASGKEQAQGEFLMTLGARIMRTPNLGAAIGQGIQEGLPGLAANRKEANMLMKDQRDYNLNLAKAKEAAAQGRDDLAFKYADLAEKAQYHAGMIGAYMARASGAGGNLTYKQYDSARKAADAALENELKRLGPRARLMTPEQRDAFRTEAYNRTLQAIQSGVMPTAPDPRVVSELPQGGNVLPRD